MSTERTNTRNADRVVRLALLIMLIGGATRPVFLRALTPDWSGSRNPAPSDGLATRPLRLMRDPMPTELVRFLEHVAKVTPDGSRIAVVLPAHWQHADAWYAHHRVHYLLAGRLAAQPADARSPLFGVAQYVATWQPAYEAAAGEVVMQSHGGTLRRGTSP